MKLVSTNTYKLASNQSTATATLADNDVASLPTVSLTAPDPTATEEGNFGSYRITRNDNQGELTVKLAIDASSSASLNDIDALFGSGLKPLSATEYELTIAAGLSSVDVDLLPRNDGVAESAEDLIFKLLPSREYQIGTTTAAVTIAPNDQPTVAIAAQTASAEEGSHHEFTVSLSNPSTKAVSVIYATSDGTTQPNETDYKRVQQGQLNFAPGELTKTIAIASLEDDRVEGDETFNVRLLSAIDALLSPGQRDAQSAIIDNDIAVTPPIAADPKPVLTQHTGNWFEVGGTGSQTFKVALTGQQTSNVNELGMFKVDDVQGRIDGIAPGETGYTAAAMARSRVVLSALAQNSDSLFPGLNTTRHLTADSGSYWGFYLVSDSTTDTIKGMIANGQTPRSLAFGFPESGHLQVSENGSDALTIAFDDGSGAIDFNDLRVTLSLSLGLFPPIGTALQGQEQREIIDLRDQTGFQASTAQFFSEAAYKNELGFYRVDTAEGWIDNLAPGETGYAAAALARRIDFSQGFEGGDLFAPYMVANGSAAEFLAQNPTNQLSGNIYTYFAYLGANPDRVDHVRLLGDNTFAFEDLLGGGDFDYDDAIVQIEFA